MNLHDMLVRIRSGVTGEDDARWIEWYIHKLHMRGKTEHETPEEPSLTARFLCWWLRFLALGATIFLVLKGAAFAMQSLGKWVGIATIIVLVCAVGAAALTAGPPPT